MRFLRRLFVADERLRARADDLQAAIDAERRLHEITAAERDALAAVVARDRARIEAETASYSRQRAEHEGTNDARPRVVA